MDTESSQKDPPDDPEDVTEARLALAMLEAARAEGDRVMIATAELRAYAAARRLAARLSKANDERSR